MLVGYSSLFSLQASSYALRSLITDCIARGQRKRCSGDVGPIVRSRFVMVSINLRQSWRTATPVFTDYCRPYSLAL